jgi:DNA-binding PadR family transcriptional regulator
MNKQFWAFPGAFPWAGFAFGRHGRFFEAGEVRLAILSLLAEGPKHGYQLMKEMKDRSSGMYSASAGTVYPTLQQLEDEGLIEAAQAGGKRVYSLTEAGQKELEKDPEIVRQIWERAERCGDWGQFTGPDAMMLYGPLAALMRASLQAAGRANNKDVRAILDRAIHELEEL